MIDLTERQLAEQLFSTSRTRPGLAARLGWRSYRVTDSRGTNPGYPDQTIWRERVVFVELKRENGRLSPSQSATLTELAAAGAEVYVWRPSDLEEAAWVLKRCGRPGPVESSWTTEGRRHDEGVPGDAGS